MLGFLSAKHHYNINVFFFFYFLSKQGYCIYFNRYNHSIYSSKYRPISLECVTPVANVITSYALFFLLFIFFIEKMDIIFAEF